MLHRDLHGAGPRPSAGNGLLVIGEAPGVTELQTGIPFTGASGRILRRLMANAGLSVEATRLENVVERGLPSNDFASLYDSMGLPGEELQAWYADLHARISALQPRVIVACGDNALHAVLQAQTPTISQSHCYLLHSEPEGIPVIPVYHPAFIYRQPDWSHWLEFGLTKARQLLENTAQLSSNDVLIRPSVEDACAFLRCAAATSMSAIDIECDMKTHALQCISVAYHDRRPLSMSIPLTDPTYREAVFVELRALLASPTVTKVYQNYIFDTLLLWRNGVPTSLPISDTMVLAAISQPELPKGLADLGRLHCFCAPWKLDWSLSGTSETLWRYNALDALRTLEIHSALRAELEQRNLWAFYATYVEPLYGPVLTACQTGLLVDPERLSALQQTLKDQLAPLTAQLVELGNPFVPPKRQPRKYRDKAHDIVSPDGTITQKAYTTRIVETQQTYNPASPAQTKGVLEAMGYRIPTKDKRPTTDRTALIKLMHKKPSPFLAALITHSSLHKLATSYASLKTDDDGRVRFSYRISGTKSGRFACDATPWGTGLNIQTIPRPAHGLNLRTLFVPDPGHVFVQTDLSQAELRIVAWLSNDAKLISLLDSGQDVHAYTAAEVSRQTGLDCPRQLGKRLNHAANYQIGPVKFSESCLLEANLQLTPADAESLLRARARTFPGIPAWHDAIRVELQQTRRLITPHGRTRSFFGLYSNDMLREALSYIPQATVSDITNSVWVSLSRHPEYGATFVVLQQGHDSLLLQVRKEALVDFLPFIRALYQSQSITIRNTPRVIPADIALGSDWGSLEKLS